MSVQWKSVFAVTLFLCLCLTCAADTAHPTGGIAVFIGTEDIDAVEQWIDDHPFLAQILVDSPEKEIAIRRKLYDSGQLGRITVRTYIGGPLPFPNRFVNAVVIPDTGYRMPDEELKRILAPRGVLLAFHPPSAIRHPQFVQPLTPGLDEWPQYLRDASNNAVSKDQLIAPPKRLQWLAKPRFGRHHDHMSSISAAVSAGGRLFSILDEGPRWNVQLPAEWKLVARDAWNGKQLWKRDIEHWVEHLWALKDGPATLPRRLIATENRVYVTLGMDAPVSVLDAATGETITEWEETAGAEELVMKDGLVYVLRSDTSPFAGAEQSQSVKDIVQFEALFSWPKTEKQILAVDIQTGKTQWSVNTPVMPLTLTADERHVYLHDGNALKALDRATGAARWKSALEVSEKLPAWYAPTVVTAKGLILFSGGNITAPGMQAGGGGTDAVIALDAATGNEQWRTEHPSSGYKSPEDLFVIDGHVWYGDTTHAKGESAGRVIARRLLTGERVRDFMPDVETHWFHHRCHRARATEDYLLLSRNGVEFVDLEKESWKIHHWTRGACLYGILPANGMIYLPPHPCACYTESKLNGYYALAGDATPFLSAASQDDGKRHVKAADMQVSGFRFQVSEKDWPTYRYDAARSGYTPHAVPKDLGRRWATRLSAVPSAPVVAAGKVFVAVPERHAVVALNEKSGDIEWEFPTGAPVDSPPTVIGIECRVSSEEIKQSRRPTLDASSSPDTPKQVRGSSSRHPPAPSASGTSDTITHLCIFGSRDGWMRAVDADSGELVWSYRCAPHACGHLIEERLESVWPLHGNPLIVDGVLYTVAGRSIFLDGGLRMVRLNPTTGEKLGETVWNEYVPGTAEDIQHYIEGMSMPTAVSDILSYNGERFFMRTQAFTAEGKRTGLNVPERYNQRGEEAHLFATAGFLDDHYWHRSFWVYGRSFNNGAAYYKIGRYTPTGKILVFNDNTIFGFGRQAEYFKWTTPLAYQLYAAPKDHQYVRLEDGEKLDELGGDFDWGWNPTKPPKLRIEYTWNREDMPILVTAMALADDTLLAAGPEAIFDEPHAAAHRNDSRVRRNMRDGAEAFRGAFGGRLMLFSADDGSVVRTLDIPFAPVFDGMAVANESVYLSGQDGTVMCFREIK